MGWIISMILAFVVFFILRTGGRVLRRSEDRLEEDRKLKHKLGGILNIASKALLVFWVVIGSLITAGHQIPTGNTGIVYEFGAIRSQVSEGLQFVAPWRSVRIANIQVQSHKFEKLVAFSQETQEVFVDATLNIRISPSAIQRLYREVGPDYFKIIVSPRVLQNFKDETVKYKSVDIAPHREDVRQEVRRRLEGELSSYSIEVTDLLLDNIDFNQNFKNAIEAKQIATQNALEEEQKVVMVRHQAEQALEKAQGEGNAIFAIAERQAAANTKLAESLSPELIHYTMVQKLSDKIEVMLLPTGQNFILGSDMLRSK